MFLIQNDKIFTAVIGDIKNSRHLEKRNEVQVQLRNVLEEINEKYEADISAKFLITLGDEFQGLLYNAKGVLKIISEIQMRLYPVELRFGIGIGKITTDINTEMALGADGPGYYNARMAINLLKENENRNKTLPSNIYLVTDEVNKSTEIMLNTIFELISAVERSWTERQREIIWDMLKHQDGQKNTAYRMGITQSSVQKALAAGNYYVYERALKNIGNILEEMT